MCSSIGLGGSVYLVCGALFGQKTTIHCYNEPKQYFILLHRDAAVGAKLISNTSSLARSEFSHASDGNQNDPLKVVYENNLLVVGEIHEIVNRVYSWATRAGIAAGGTAGRGETFSRGIVDLVPCTITTTLIGVVEANPVSDIMSQHLIVRVQSRLGFFE